jgi:hypothetical protein
MKMDDDELLDLLRRKEDAAGGYVWGQLGQERATAMREYRRQPYGTLEELDDLEGRSQIVASDVSDTVEWILPSLIKTFTAADKAVEFEPTKASDVQGAEQATDTCNYVFFKQNNGFLVLYTAIKDALVVRNCAVTWRKETKESVVSVPFKSASGEMLAMLQQEQPDSEIAEATPAPMLDPQGQMMLDETGQPVVQYSGRIKRTEKREIIKVEAFSPDDLLIDRLWTSPLLADCPYVCRFMRVTTTDLKLMGHDVTAEELRVSSDRHSTNTLRNVGLNGLAGLDDVPELTADDSMAEGWLRIEYVLADTDGDGIAERRCIYRLQDRILSNEECAGVPFATFSPRMNTHRWDGASMHDAVGDLQKLHSEILNQTLDNLKLANNPRTKLLTDANGSPYANIDDLLDSRIGGIIRQQRLDAVTEQVTPFSAAASFPMLEYVQGMRENRTGVSRTSQGMNPDSLNNTATGRQIDQTASQQPTELIARIIAECLMKPIMMGILKLLTEGGMEKLAFRLRGEFVEYDPNEWRDSYDMTINVGLGSGDTQAKGAALQNVYQLQQAGMQNGMATPKHLYHTAGKIIENAGFKDIQNFLQDPSQQPPQQPQTPIELQLEQMKQQGKQQGDAAKFQAEAQAEAQRMGLQDQQHQREIARDMQAEQNKQEMQARDTQHTAQLDAQKAQLQAQLDRDRHNAELNHAAALEQMRLNNAREIAEMNNARAIQVAQIAAQQAFTLADYSAQQAAANGLTKDFQD